MQNIDYQTLKTRLAENYKFNLFQFRFYAKEKVCLVLFWNFSRYLISGKNEILAKMLYYCTKILDSHSSVWIQFSKLGRMFVWGMMPLPLPLPLPLGNFKIRATKGLLWSTYICCSIRLISTRLPHACILNTSGLSRTIVGNFWNGWILLT